MTDSTLDQRPGFDHNNRDGGAPGRKGFSGKQVLLFILLAMLVTAGITYWIIRTYVYASDFKPVELSQKEQRKLDDKLAALGLNPKDLMPDADRPSEPKDQFDADGRLQPERYSEDPQKRQINLSERELNAMLASNADLARRFAVDLSDSLASAKLLIPVDPDMPVLGGKTLRVNAGLELDYRNTKPVVILRGVSVMGVPIPNAWLGNLKNVDLVEQFGGNPGFWRSFSDGVELIEINDGALKIKLKE
ncbi:MAG: arginine N-succinyltransferase [Pseudomonadales bacterium]